MVDSQSKCCPEKKNYKTVEIHTFDILERVIEKNPKICILSVLC